MHGRRSAEMLILFTSFPSSPSTPAGKFVVHFYMHSMCTRHPHAGMLLLSTCLSFAADLIQVLQQDFIVRASLAVLVWPFCIVFCYCPAEDMMALHCWSWLPTRCP